MSKREMGAQSTKNSCIEHKDRPVKAHLQTVSFHEGLQKVRDVANSEEFLLLSSRYGKRPDGENRIQVLTYPLVHRSKFAKRLKREGFDPQKRNPYLLGFCFFPESMKDLGEHEKLDKVTAFVIGAIWNPSGCEDVPPTVLEAKSADPRWNTMVKKVAAKVGLEIPWFPLDEEEFWEARQRFADGIRQKLLKEGIVGIQLGGEVEVMDTLAIHIIKGGL